MRASRAAKSRAPARQSSRGPVMTGRAALRRRARRGRSGLPWLVAAGLSGAALLGWIGLSNGVLAARR
jgi:hypothetical protein